jgi:hypothetical protein
MVEGLSEKLASPGMVELSGELLGVGPVTVRGFGALALAGPAGPVWQALKPKTATTEKAARDKRLPAKRIGFSPY